MRVVIDNDKCTGNGRCYSLFPDLFGDDDRGYGTVIGDGRMADNETEKAKRVVMCCPEQAIIIEET